MDNTLTRETQAAGRYQVARRVTLIGAVINAFLAAGKIALGFVGHSQGLVADGFHSLADLITDALVVFASRLGSQQADLDHPYGHGRIETAATVILSILLIITGVGIIGQAIYKLINPTQAVISSFTLWIAFVSVIANELLFHYTLSAARKSQSELLRANAWHHRSDAASSLVVLLGIIGSLLGYAYLDAITAIIVGFLIVKMSWDFGWDSLRELVDTGVDASTLQILKQTIQAVPGVKALHSLRNRSMAGRILIDVHVQVNSDITVSEGHYIATQVHQQLLTALDNIEDVTVHIDPENDEEGKSVVGLPSRAEFYELLKLKLDHIEAYRHCTEIRLHYLHAKLGVEILLPNQYFADAIRLRTMINEALATVSYISFLKLLFEVAEE